jgi:DnaJ-class molecular chaperone
MRSAYEILGVLRSASSPEIRAAYKRLAKTSHPDISGGGSEAHEKFLEIKAAYEILADPDTREAYDRDPSGKLEVRVQQELRLAQLTRRRKRLRRLYE